MQHESSTRTSNGRGSEKREPMGTQVAPGVVCSRRKFAASLAGTAAWLASERGLGARAANAEGLATINGGVTMPEGMAGLRSTTVRVNGIPMHTVLSDVPAERDGPALVLVHGLALSGRYMLPTAQAMMHRYPVYVPDLPGFGDSGKPRRVLDVPQLADALSAWMSASGLHRAMLLGNSFGCQIIADLAARYPAQVERGVLQGPTTPPNERSWILQFIRWQQNSPFTSDEMGEIAYSDYAKCGIVRALLTFQLSLRDRIEDKLPRIAAPMQVVRGELDPICHQWWAEQVTELLPQGALTVVPETAHTMTFMSPRELADASLPFLDASERSESWTGS